MRHSISDGSADRLSFAFAFRTNGVGQAPQTASLCSDRRFDVLFRPAHTSISIVASAEGIHTVYTLNDVHHLATVDGISAASRTMFT